MKKEVKKSAAPAKKVAPAPTKPTKRRAFLASIPKEGMTLEELSNTLIDRMHIDYAANTVTLSQCLAVMQMTTSGMSEFLFHLLGKLLSEEDRKHLTGMGVHRHGFAEICIEKARAFPHLIPSWLNLDDMEDQLADFEEKQSLFDNAATFSRVAYDVLLKASNAVYENALRFYASVKEAAKHGIPGAAQLLKELQPYFQHATKKNDEPTMKQLERDVRSLLHGTKDGRIVIENRKPTTTAGSRTVIDEMGGEKRDVEITN